MKNILKKTFLNNYRKQTKNYCMYMAETKKTEVVRFLGRSRAIFHLYLKCEILGDCSRNCSVYILLSIAINEFLILQENVLKIWLRFCLSCLAFLIENLFSLCTIYKIYHNQHIIYHLLYIIGRLHKTKVLLKGN